MFGSILEGGKARLFSLARKKSVQAMAASMVSLSAARLLTLIMAAIIARRMGPEGFGTFTFATGLALLAGQLGSLGWPVLITRMIPKFTVNEDWGRLHGLLRCADLVVLGMMVVMAISFILAAVFFLDPDNSLHTSLFVAAALVVPTGFRLQHRQQAAVLGRPAIGIFLDEAVTPLFIVIGCVILWFDWDTAIYVIYAVGTFASAIATRILCRMWSDPRVFATKPVFEFGIWMKIAFPMVTASAARVILNRIDTVLLAPLSTVYEVALYNVAFRVAFVATMLPMMTNGVIRPMLAAAHERGDFGRVDRVMRTYYVFTLLAASCVSLPLVIFAPEILRLLFGEEFVAAASILRVLAIGALIGALAEASSSYMLMCGKERFYGTASAINVAVCIAANIVVIPSYGALGVAVVNVTASLVFLAIMLVAVSRNVRRTKAQSG